MTLANESDDSGYYFYMEYPAVKLALLCCYSTLFIVGILSNVLVCVIGIKTFRLQCSAPPTANRAKSKTKITMAVTNLLVANLAVGDIVLCLFSVPSTPFSYYYPNWPLGEFACRLLPSTLIAAVCVISFTSTIIAIDRYLAIIQPNTSRLGRKSSVIVIIIVWILSIACSVPIFLAQEIITYNDPDGIFVSCRESWPTLYQRIFSITILSLQFAIPFLVIAFCYTRIFHRIRAQDEFRYLKLIKNQ